MKSVRQNHAVLTAVALVAPGLAVSATPWRGFGELLFVGTIPVLIGLMHGRKFALWASPATATLVVILIIASPSPIAATLVMASIGLGIGASSLRGWQTVAVVTASWPSVLLISPPAALSDHGWLGTGTSVVVFAGVATLLGGAWTLAVTTILLPKPPTGQFAPQSGVTATVYGASLASLLGGIAFVATTWGAGTMAGWVLLTVLVVARPGYAETRQRVITRALGTVVGGIVAGAFGILVPLPALVSVVGLVCLGAAVILQLKKANYALYSVALTASIVLLNAGGGRLIEVDAQRVVFTLLGTLLSGVLVVILQLILRRPAPDPVGLAVAEAS